jgi:hypothetical protein
MLLLSCSCRPLEVAMLPVPESLSALLCVCASAFTRPTCEHVPVLVTGPWLTSGRRTVTAAVRAVGRGGERHCTSSHRVLTRAVWSPLCLSRILLHLLVTTVLAPDAPLVLLIDGTLERRWGPKIALQGRSHDAVRSQPGHVVTTEGIPCAIGSASGSASRGSSPARGVAGSGPCRSCRSCRSLRARPP